MSYSPHGVSDSHNLTLHRFPLIPPALLIGVKLIVASDRVHIDHSALMRLPNGLVSISRLQPALGFSLKVGDTLELREIVNGRRDGDFFRVRQILRHSVTGLVTIRGWRVRRIGKLRGLVQQVMNETFLQIDRHELDHDSPNLEDGLQDIILERDVLHIDGAPVQRRLVITNKLYPDLVEGPENTSSEAEYNFRTQGKLICRWVWTQYLQSTETAWPKNATLRRIYGQEADSGADDSFFAAPDAALLKAWRHSLPGDDSSTTTTTTFGDLFSGAGGFTHGALRAGIHLMYALDNNSYACQTYVRNAPDMQVINEDTLETLDETFLGYLVKHERVFFHLNIHSFVQYAKERWSYFRIDILHISPPCQFFSPANTGAGYKAPESIAGRRDDQNQAALYIVGDALDVCRPRIVTMEETSGIFHSQHWRDFRSLIQMFTDRGYSVSWREDNAVQHGVPSERMRMILRASCAGHMLPAHPGAACGPGTLRPKKTINDCVSDLHPGLHADHDPDFSLRTGTDPLGNGAKPLRRIITCSGTDDSHPYGGPWTIRELARLTTLSDDYIFPCDLTYREKVRQIGNMVPANVAEALMHSAKACIVKVNRRIQESLAERQELIHVQDNMCGATAGSSIHIDSDEDASDVTIGEAV